MRLIALFPALLLAAAGGCHRQEPPAPQAQPPAPEASGGATIVRGTAGKAAPAAAIEGPDGASVTLAAFKGQPVLLNLWATWCGPCIKEMPMLDALAKAQAGRLTVLTVSQDMEGRRVVAPFFARHRYAALKPWLDKDNKLMLQLGETGLPVSVLYDAQGKELWRVRGDLDWTGARAKALLAEAGV